VETLDVKVDGVQRTLMLLMDLLEKHGQCLLAIHKAVTAEPEGPKLGDILAQLITVVERLDERLESIEGKLDRLLERAIPH